MPNEITITLLDDGSGGFKTDSTKLQGSEKEILELYEDLAGTGGGDFKVEKHVHGLHQHHGHKQHLHQGH